ncbi:HNH endonuclease [Mycolicibacterium porcinum]|uniref:HNH endonuclease n=1 Tax=Mycolicibacterium porcinum TaxID=39693 RepID=UPI001195877D|nr:HNH endonuclease signature motif containing protein [Mycolicibacterium porcinum]TVX97851.1 HNH endonuclease [Mycolicibacterium porcinum]
MTTVQRENDATTKRLRTNLRNRHNDCHICGQPIDYQLHHLDPGAFQMDHLLQIANGGPNTADNVAASHRFCNRARSDTIDHIAIAAAERLGIPINTNKTALYPGRTPAPERRCSTPDGQLCEPCRGTHNPSPGVTWVTARRWWT